MLGLQSQHDIQNISRITASSSSQASQGRSYKFAKKLSDAGFAVSGYTNSMERHTNKVRKDGALIEKKVNLNTKLSQEQFINKQDSETRADAQRLAELEEQLAEIQRKRELKRARDRERRRRRREFMAACCIQRTIKYYVKTRLAEAAYQIRKFITLVKNKNALTVAAWAAKIISTWAKNITHRWHTERMRRLAMEIATRQRIERERHIAAVEMSVRSTAAKGTIMTVLRTCMVTVAKKEITIRRDKSRADKKATKWRGGAHKKAANKPTAKATDKSRSPSPTGSHASEGSPSGIGGSFLTETLGHGHDEADEEEDEDDGPPTQDTTSQMINQSRRNFVNSNNIPGGDIRRGGFSDAPAPDAFDFDMAANMGDLGLDKDLEDDYDEEVELEKERKAKLLEAHREREAEMIRERELRLRALAKKKLFEAEESFRQREAERLEKEARENARLDWLSEQEEAAIARAQFLTRKRKQAEKDAKRAAKELVLMGAEDFRTKQQNDLKAAAEKYDIPRRKPKKVRELTEFEIEMAEQCRIEDEEAAKKAAEDLAKRNKEATAKRLSEFKEAEEKARLASIEAAKVKAEKIAKVEEERKIALKKAIQAKKLAVAHRKQLEKEQLAMDLSDKVGGNSGGRTHNAFGKPLGVKGFVREKVNSRGKLRHDRKSLDSEDSRLPGNGKRGLEISSKLRVNDPSVDEWNYKLNTENEEEDSSSSVQFPFGDFLLNAQQHNLLDVDDALLESGDFSDVVADQGQGEGEDKDKEYWPFGEESNDEEEMLGVFAEPPVETTPRGTGADARTDQTADKDPSPHNSAKDKENEGMGPSVPIKKKIKKRGLQKNDPNAPVVHAGQGPIPIVPDKKMSIKQITGESHIRDNLRVPKGLKDTPYFKSYVSVKAQAKGDKAAADSATVNTGGGTKSIRATHSPSVIAQSEPSPHLAQFAADVKVSSVMSSLPELPSPLDLAPPSKHPLLMAQTRALNSKIKTPTGSKKVEELHALIAKARTKVETTGIAPAHPAIIQGSESEPVLGSPRVPFQRPPEELDIHVDSPSGSPHINGNNADDEHDDENEDHVLQGSLEEYYFANANEDDGAEFTSVVHAAKMMVGGDHFPSAPTSTYVLTEDSPVVPNAQSPQQSLDTSLDSHDTLDTDNDYDHDNGDGDDAIDREQEAALNAECDMLRLRLEAKMGIPVMATNKKEKVKEQPYVPLVRVSAPPPKAPGPSAPVSRPTGAPLLLAKDILQSAKNKSKNIGDSSSTSHTGGYKIGIDIPDFSLELMKQWATEDEEMSPVRSPQSKE